MDIIETLSRLCAAGAVTGAEGDTAKLAAELLSEYTDNIETDALGSVIARLGSEGENILLEAHIDKIGLIVTAVDEKTGFLHIERCGGTDRRVLAGARVKVYGERELAGVITSTPPHLAKKGDDKVPEITAIFADTGLPADEVKQLVRPGDRIGFDSPLRVLNGSRVCSPYIDDCAGMLAVLRCLEILKEANSKHRVTVLFSTQEETGGSGAKTAAFGIAPDVALCCDVSFARQPGAKDEESAPLGSGPMICISPVIQRELSSRLTELAKLNNIPYTFEISGRDTGTDADDVSVSRSGVRTGLASIPLRNMHTPAETGDIKDIEATAQLFARFVMNGGKN